jgi:hypothetical protein
MQLLEVTSPIPSSLSRLPELAANLFFSWHDQPLVAYFCAEYGFHESFPIYSGGLGILAGDHCKAASDER